jgi:sec-independent protein translocase protein TatB
MFNMGPSELLLVSVIGLLVLGPKRLPKVAAEIGKWVGRARRTASQLRRQLEREIELSDIEKPDPPSKPPSPPAPPTLAEAASEPAPTAPASGAAKSGNGAADPHADAVSDDGHKIGGRVDAPPPFDPTDKPEV